MNTFVLGEGRRVFNNTAILLKCDDITSIFIRLPAFSQSTTHGRALQHDSGRCEACCSDIATRARITIIGSKA